MNAWNTRLSGIGLLVAVVAVIIALDARSTRVLEPGPGERLPAREIEELRRKVLGLREETRRLRDEVAARSVPAPARATSPAAAVAVLPAARPAPEARPAEAGATRDEIFSLLKKIIAKTASAGEAERFWRFARASDQVGRLLEELEAEVAAGPTSADARMRLADGYVIKLLTLPVGPEMGHWGAKAEGEWKEVLRLEPSHWQARLNLAVSLSYHPDVEGVTPDAIRHLTRLVEEQESLAPEPRHAGVFRLLAILHRRQGDVPAARNVIRRGLERHPEDDGLRKAREEDETGSEG